MDIKLCSYNVRGLGNKSKREHIFAWLKEKQFSVCLLQETHSGDGTHDVWGTEWGIDSFFSGKKNNSEGIAILVNSNFSYNIKEHKEIIVGRVQALELIINDKELVILNIYGPNSDDIFCFEMLENYLKENLDKTVIIGGDFNTVLNIELDKKNGRIDTHKLCRSKLNKMIDEYELVDIWRSKHPCMKQ